MRDRGHCLHLPPTTACTTAARCPPPGRSARPPYSCARVHGRGVIRTHGVVLGIQQALEYILQHLRPQASGLMCYLSRQTRGSASLLPQIAPSMLAETRSTSSRDKVNEPGGSTGRAIGVCGAEESTGLQRMPCGSRSTPRAFSSYFFARISAKLLGE